MLQQATEDRREDAAEVPPAVPAPRSTETIPPADPGTFSFVDIEHVEVEQAELDALAASWDGFL